MNKNVSNKMLGLRRTCFTWALSALFLISGASLYAGETYYLNASVATETYWSQGDLTTGCSLFDAYGKRVHNGDNVGNKRVPSPENGVLGFEIINNTSKNINISFARNSGDGMSYSIGAKGRLKTVVSHQMEVHAEKGNYDQYYAKQGSNVVMTGLSGSGLETKFVLTGGDESMYTFKPNSFLDAITPGKKTTSEFTVKFKYHKEEKCVDTGQKAKIVTRAYKDDKGKPQEETGEVPKLYVAVIGTYLVTIDEKAEYLNPETEKQDKERDAWSWNWFGW